MMKLLPIALLTSGCFWVTTKSEGETLRKDVTSLQSRLDTKEKTLDSQIAQLHSVLEDATKVLKRNSADIGADVDQLRNDVRVANGLATTINNSINDLKTAFDTYRKTTDAHMDAIEARVAQIESGKPSANSSPADLWKLGSEAFQAQRFNDAIEIFKRLETTYPNDGKAPDALYFKGQSYTSLKDWDHAIGAYRALLDRYPQSSLADDGLYMAAMAAKEIKSCDEAIAYLSTIKTKYKSSNVIKQAADLETAIKRETKNKAKCN